MRTFFDTDGPFFRTLEYISNLFFLNIMTVLMCIPVITAGASITAMHYVLMQMIDEREGHIIRTFWKQFGINFKSSTPAWLILLAAGLIFYGDYRLVRGGTYDLPHAFLVIALIGLFIVFAVFLWIFPYLARFSNTTSGALKNAVILAAGSFPRTLAMIAITAGVIFLFTQVSRLIPLVFICGISLPGYLDALLYYPVLRPLIEKAAEKNSPEETPSQERNEKQ